MARLALISDTHLPVRLAELPAPIFKLLDGCDLVLHAGDVGALETLDQLAGIAPVVAVRGNDWFTDSADALPLEQLVAVEEERILLWHGHFEDRSDELAWRGAADWPDIFDRLSSRARARGASIVVTGHTHIPLAREHDGLLLVNPGAIAPGNAFLVQMLRSVAILELSGKGRDPEVTHVDIDTGEPFVFELDPRETFDVVARRVQRTLLSEAIRPFKRRLNRFYLEDAGFRSAWLEIAHRVWAGAQETISLDEARTALAAGGSDARELDEELGRRSPAPEATTASS